MIAHNAAFYVTHCLKSGSLRVIVATDLYVAKKRQQ